MARVRNSVQTRARHKKWIKRAKGYRGRRNRVFKLAKEAVLKAGQYAYRDRRRKKTVFRQQWQTHINAAARQHDMNYSTFMHGLKTSQIELDRKILSQIAQENPELFAQVVEQAKQKG